MNKNKIYKFQTTLLLQSCLESFYISRSRILFCLLFLIFFNSLHAQNWQNLGSGTNVQVRKIYGDSINDKLYAIGEFTEAGGLIANHIAQWDGFAWHTMGYSNAGPDVIMMYDSAVYLGGGFGILSSKPIRGVGKWNGTTWDSLQIQPFKENQLGIIFAMTFINNDLYIGGIFNSVAGIPVNSLAKWDGNNWSSLAFPPLFDNYIYAICQYNGNLYVGGNFYSSAYPNDTIQSIICYDGSNWKQVGGGLHGGMDEVSSMVVYKNELYVAGTFTVADGNPGNYIAKWDGTNWSDVGGGVIGLYGGNGQVRDLIVYNDELYAGGAFSFAGGVPAKYVAKWNGTVWCGLGSNFDNIITSLAFYKDTLYAGGAFWTIDGDSMNYIAKWTGGSYVDTCGNSSGIEEITESQNEFQLYPNPFTNSTTLQSTKQLQNATLTIYDILGNEVKHMQNLNGNEIQINRVGLKSGMYFFNLIDSEGLIGNGKLIIE